jgi:hypothetical protein
MKRLRLYVAALVAIVAARFMLSGAEKPARGRRSLPELKVSDNKRFLVTAEGRPLFYLGDTPWELFHRLDRNQSIEYLTSARRTTTP